MAERSGRYLIEFKDVPTERQKLPELPVEERVTNFDEVELDFSQEQAMAEAVRCLSCRRCIGCALCLAACHNKGIDFSQVDNDIEIEADSIIIAPGVERTPAYIDEKYGYGKFTNVVTFAQFERILSDNGVYDGLVLRPYDGEIPTRIAFVPVGLYLDASALARAAKAALAAHRKIPNLEETHLFFADAESYQAELKKELGGKARISLGSGEVSAITENGDTRNLVVEYDDNGKTMKEEFQLVVLVTAYELPDDIKDLVASLGVDLANSRFQDTADASLLKTAREGLSFTGLGFSG